MFGAAGLVGAGHEQWAAAAPGSGLGPRTGPLFPAPPASWGPTPSLQNPIDRLTATANNQPVAGNTSHQMMELGLDRGEVRKDIGMIVFKVVDHRCFGTVMNEFGALVEKG